MHTPAALNDIFDWRAIFSVLPNPCLILDLALVIVEVNQAYLNATQRARGELLGKYMFDAFPDNPSDPRANGVKNLHSSLQRVLQNRIADKMAVQQYDIPIGDPKQGHFEVRYWNPTNTPVFNSEGNLTHIIHQVEDITSQFLSEMALRESERRFRALTNATADVIYRMSPDWKRMHQLDGRGFLKDTESQAEYRIEDYVPVEDRERARNAVAEAIRNKTVYELEHRVLRVDGSRGWTYSKAVPLLDADGEIQEWIGAASDITDRKEAEAALSASEAKYRELFSNMVQEVHFWELVRDEQGQITTWRLQDANPPALKTWGRTLEEVQGKTADEIFGPGTTAHYMPIVEKVIGENNPYAYEDYLPNLDRHFRFITVPLGDHFITTGADITTIKRAIAENEQLLAQLREADKRKDEFLAMLAHELRNPLAPISAAANLMEIAQLDAARLKQTSQIISRQVRHMTGLVDDLLDVSRVTRGLATLTKVELDVKHVIADAIEQVRPIVEGKRHRLTLDLDPEPAHILGDQKRLVQILTNLLNNAAKFTPEGGSLHLSMLAPEGHVILRIADNGNGISADLQPRVFDLFAQGERSSDRSQGGLGIGLSLVKSLVELHGGTVVVYSEGIGKGSEFNVTLPRIHKRQEDATKNPGLATSIAAGTSKRILVVDDNADAAQMLAMYLEMAGHRVFVEHSSKGALERVNTVLPEACILDIGLPEMDGNELARRLKSNPVTEKIVLIAVTGYAQELDRQSAIQAGFDYHLAKPVDARTLLNLLS